ncbi:MAG: exosome complex exonuclease Rrp41 [Candidatus Woesearchaeota archaeon]
MYDKRFDGRKAEQLRPIEAKVGVIKQADGSASFRIGKTWALAAVYGPRELHPKFLQNPATGILRCNYNMMPFSGMGDRVRPGGNRRAKELSMVTEKSLLPVLDLKKYPNAVVDVFIELPQTDAGSRCAGICAASMALADAGIEMKDLVCAVAVGHVDNNIILDLTYEEEHYPEYAKDKVENPEVADIAVSLLPNSNGITLLQMDGIITKEKLHKALELAKNGAKQIFEIQKTALKEKYKGE